MVPVPQIHEYMNIVMLSSSKIICIRQFLFIRFIFVLVLILMSVVAIVTRIFPERFVWSTKYASNIDTH